MDLKEIRNKLDSLDDELLNILKKRFDLMPDVAQYKKENNLPIHHPSREAEILESKKELAKQLNLNPKIVEKIFKIIMEESKRIQKEL